MKSFSPFVNGNSYLSAIIKNLLCKKTKNLFLLSVKYGIIFHC